jgi:hypothetical protein
VSDGVGVRGGGMRRYRRVMGGCEGCCKVYADGSPINPHIPLPMPGDHGLADGSPLDDLLLSSFYVFIKQNLCLI